MDARDDLLLLYGVKDTARNNAVALRDHLKQHLARARQATADGAGGDPAQWLRWVCPAARTCPRCGAVLPESD